MSSPEDVRAPSPESNGRASTATVEEGVLANLPRTRPQRTTERRIASRRASRPAGRTAKGAGDAAAKGAGNAAAKGAGDAAAKGAGDAAAKGSGTAAPKRGTAGTTKGATRATAKRATGAAENGAGAHAGAQAGPKRATRAAASRKPRKAAKPRTRTAPGRVRPEPVDSAPRQGFESESTRTTTGPVQPPGGAELVAGAVEIVGEVARAGVSAGERVLRDLFSRLPH